VLSGLPPERALSGLLAEGRLVAEGQGRKNAPVGYRRSSDAVSAQPVVPKSLLLGLECGPARPKEPFVR
jgi:hypothetical protein